MSLLLSREFYFEVRKGNVSGHSAIHKYGMNPDIDTGGFEAIWNGGGLYTGFNAAAADTVEYLSSVAADAGTVLSSGSATGGSATTLVDTGAGFDVDGVAVGDLVINDTKLIHGVVTNVAATTLTVHMWQDLTFAQIAAGKVGPELDDAYRVVTPASTGAAVIKIYLALDGNYAEVQEYVVLNGTTVVEGASVLRLSRLRVILAGSGAENAGTITARQKTDNAIIWAVTPIGYNNSTICAYTVPAGKKAYLTHWFASLNKKQTAASNIRLLIAPVGQPLMVLEEYSIDSTGTSKDNRPFRIPKDNIPGRTDLVIHADSSVNDGAIAGGFDLMLVDD